MLQILIWAACVIIFGIGYCGWQLEEMKAIQKGAKHTTGITFLILMTILAAGLFALSLSQGNVIAELLKK